MFGRLKFKGVDKKRISDEAHVEDYKSALEIGRVRLGKLCMYYRDLGVKYYVPYDYIERCFCRISECQPDDSPAYYYYRLILVHGEKEFANLIFNEKEDVEKILDDVIFLDRGCVVLESSVDEIRETRGVSVDALFREVFKC